MEGITAEDRVRRRRWKDCSMLPRIAKLVSPSTVHGGTIRVVQQKHGVSDGIVKGRRDCSGTDTMNDQDYLQQSCG